MGTQLQCAVGKSHETSSLYVDDIVPILKNTFDQQKFAASDQRTVPIIEIGSDDHIGDACLIFHEK